MTECKHKGDLRILWGSKEYCVECVEEKTVPMQFTMSYAKEMIDQERQAFLKDLKELKDWIFNRINGIQEKITKLEDGDKKSVLLYNDILCLSDVEEKISALMEKYNVCNSDK